MRPDTGRVIPNGSSLNESQYADRIGAALRAELGGSRRATKTVMRWADVSDRTARNWVNGHGAPSGFHLMLLARHSPVVWRMVAELSHHQEAELMADIHAAEVALAKAMGALARLKRQSQGGRTH